MSRLLAVCVLCACVSPTVAPPPWRKPPAELEHTVPAGALFTPSAPPPARYNDPVPAPTPSAVTDAVLDAAMAAAIDLGLPPPERDPRLSAAARELAAFLPGDATPQHDLASFVLTYFGIVEPYAYWLVGIRREGEIAELAQSLKESLRNVLPGGRYRRIGAGAAAAEDGHVRVVLALQESGIELAPVARELPAGGVAPLRGRVLPPYRDPKVYVARPGGEVSTIRVAAGRDGSVGADVACGTDSGALKVEIVGDDPAAGPVVLANFPVWCGVAPPRGHRVAAAGVVSGDARQIETEVFELVNQDRARANLPALQWDDAAAAAARLHSEEMREKGFVGHVSPTTGTADARARRAGIRSPRIAENVSRNYSAVETQAGLMASPGHRVNIMDPLLTHLGVGVSVGERTLAGRTELYVTQLFFRRPPEIDDKAARAGVQKAMAAARAANQLSALVEDWQLTEIADEYAIALARAHVPRSSAAAQASRRLERFGARYRSLVTVVHVVGEIGEFKDDVLLEPGVGSYGLGVAQGDDPERQERVAYIVLILGTTR